MTCYVVITLCKQWNLSLTKTKILVSDVASDIRGTTAGLCTGDLISLERLLYGLMLPSGNDAAFALAQFFGYKLFLKKYTHADMAKVRSFQFDYHPYYAKYFLREMNLFCVKYGLTQTFFDSPHGLQNVENLSTACDMAKLSALAMQNETFRRIVGTKTYECEIKNVSKLAETLRSQNRPEKSGTFGQEGLLKTIPKNNANVEIFYDNYMQFLDKYNHMNKAQRQQYELTSRKVIWENTNVMLQHSGFNGLKTGVTEAAGPCLSASYHKEGLYFTIVILNCKSMEARWTEVLQLVDWAKARLMRPSQGTMRPLPPAPQPTIPDSAKIKKDTRPSQHQSTPSGGAGKQSSSSRTRRAHITAQSLTNGKQPKTAQILSQINIGVSYHSYRNSSIEMGPNRVSRWSYGHQTLHGLGLGQPLPTSTTTGHSIYKLDENTLGKNANEVGTQPTGLLSRVLNNNHRVHSVTS
jgi:D-alanyl-D-alanine carboxypeptidase